MLFTFEGHPPSDNSLYMNMRGKGRVLTPKAREYKHALEEQVRGQIKQQDRCGHDYTKQITALKDNGLVVNIILRGNWFTKAEAYKKKDVQNYSKALLDSAFNVFKEINTALDDCQIVLLMMAKANDENKLGDQTELSIELLTMELEDEPE